MSLLREHRRCFLYAALFSLAINVLLLAPPLYMLQLFDRVLSSRSEETLTVLTLAAASALLFMALLDLFRARLLALAGGMLDRTLGPQVLENVLKETARRAAGASLHGLADVATLRRFFSGAGLIALFDVPWLPLLLVVIYLFHPLLGVAATCGAVVMILLALANERFTRGRLEHAQGHGRRAGKFIDLSVRNAEVVSALGMHAAVTQHWEALNESSLRAQLDANRIAGRFTAWSKFVRQLTQIAMLAIGASLVLEQRATPGIMIAATILLARALAPVEMVAAGWRQLAEARLAHRRVKASLQADGPVHQPVLPEPAGALVLERVSLVLPHSERPILRGITLSLGTGEFLGLIGPSASGKSTLARVMVGVWKPSSGTARLDGADLSLWPRERVGPHIGYLPQDVELFDGTVAQNIARLGAVNEAEVIRAAQRAHAHQMILRLPHGYGTHIGESGRAISAGQRQRIALARALYADPRLIVLDEPNSNLDHEGEDALANTLRQLKDDAVTLVVVAHRPSLLATADRLLVLREGAVDLLGPRAEVMTKLLRVTGPSEEAAA